MAITLVQSTKKVVTGVNNTTLAYGSNLTAGNFAINAQSHYCNPAASITTPTDTLSHVYAGAIAEQNTAGDTKGRQRTFYKENCSGGADTVTFDIVGTTTGDITVVIAEFSGMATSSSLDKTATGTALAATTHTSNATASTAQADEVLWGVFTHDGANTTITEDTGGGWAIVQENEGGTANVPIAVEYRIVASISTYSAKWTTGAARDSWMQIITFKAAAGGQSVVPILMAHYRRRW